MRDRTDIPKGLPVEPRENITIGFTMASLGSDFFNTMLWTIQERAEAYGYTLIYQVSDRNIELQNQQMDAFITQGVDVIIFNGNVHPVTAAFRSAAAAGIPVVAMGPQGADYDFSLVTCFLSSSYSAGWQVGEYTGRYMHDADSIFNIGMILMTLGSADTESRANGFLAGFQYAIRELDGNPFESEWDAIYEGYHVWREFVSTGSFRNDAMRINLVGYGHGETPDAPGGIRAANDLIAAHHNIDLLYVETDNMWPGVEVVLRQNGLVPGQDLIVACAADATRFGLEAIMSGEILAIGNNSSAMSATGIMEVIRAIFHYGEDMNNLTVNTFTPTVVINRENVDQFYDPDQPFARGIPFALQTVEEFNALAGN